MERLALPRDMTAFTNPKSSTGRIDVFTRVITDGGVAFDTIGAGYEGQLYLEVSPRTFPILARTGSRLSQIRFRQGQPRHSDEDLRTLHKKTPLIDGKADINGGLALSIDLAGDNGLVGYRGKRHAGVIDIDRTDTLSIADYWETIPPTPDKRLVLDP